MKNPFCFINISVLVSCCISILFFTNCNSSNQNWKEKDAAEDKEIAAYFDTRKPELLLRKNFIDSVLGSLKDQDEKQGLETITDPGLIVQIKSLGTEKEKIKSKFAAFDLNNFFLIYLEKDGELGGYDTDFKEDFTRQLKQTTYRHNHVNLMLMSNDTIYEYPKISYENMFAEFLKRKYLVVVDCLNYIAPEISTEETFEAGLIIKKIRIYDLQSHSLAEEYYLVAASSDDVYVKKSSENAKPSPARLQTDLNRNYFRLFKYSLFLKDRFEGE